MRNKMKFVVAALMTGILWGSAYSGEPEAKKEQQHASAESNVIYAILYRPGPAWKAGRPMSGQGLRPHGLYLKQLMEEGKLIAAGPWLEPDGGLVLTNFRSREEALALMEVDPAVTGGIFVGEARPWLIRFSNGAISQQE